MPKMKSKSSAKKRFRLTGTGKVRRARGYHNHNLSCKSAKRGRRLRTMTLVDETQAREIRRLLVS
ncbi:MAG: 50S ribosomal protein L35 [Deltaproteobacteria bacterium]|nr:50S ribosomal protein L35 [Deltaproteobacteria bacterium]